MTPGIVRAMMTAQAVVAASPEVLPPSGKWTVDYAESMCVLQRDYGTGPAKVTLGFRPLPLSEQNEIVLLTREAGGRVPKTRFGKVSMQLGVGGPVIAGTYKFWGAAEAPELRFTLISLDAVRAEDIAAAETLIIERATLPTVRLHPMANPAAFAALKVCQDDLMKSWGVDPAEMAKIVSPAVADDPAEWVTDEDYPSAAIRAGEQGSVSILWLINTDGKVSDCRVTQTSGHALLDQAACGAILRRGRYKAAVDGEGKPIRSYAARKVNWMLPF
jgi:TonB family protein